MAGKQRPGLDYSQIGCDFALKEKSVQVRIKFGILGHLVLYEVIAWINGGKGCYAEYTDNTPAAFAMSRLGDLSKAEEIKSIFLYMLEIGFFDREAFRDKILTSEGIVERWYNAKRNPESYDMPCAVRKIIDRIKQRRKKEKQQECPQNAQECPQNAQECPQNAQECRQSKVKYSNKQTNKQTSAKDFRDETPPSSPDCDIIPDGSAAVDPSPGVIANPGSGPDVSPGQPPTSGSAPRSSPSGVIAHPGSGSRRQEVRLKIVRAIYEVGLSADLVDAMTHAAMNRWINVPQVEAWRRKARDETELYRTSKGRAGKAKAWAVYRPLLEAVYLAHGATLPPCSAKRKEPPPVPADAGEDGATDAGRKVR